MIPNHISIWFIHEQCFGVYTKHILWFLPWKKSVRLDWLFRMLLFPFFPVRLWCCTVLQQSALAFPICVYLSCRRWKSMMPAYLFQPVSCLNVKNSILFSSRWKLHAIHCCRIKWDSISSYFPNCRQMRVRIICYYCGFHCSRRKRKKN